MVESIKTSQGGKASEADYLADKFSKVGLAPSLLFGLLYYMLQPHNPACARKAYASVVQLVPLHKPVALLIGFAWLCLHAYELATDMCTWPITGLGPHLVQPVDLGALSSLL